MDILDGLGGGGRKKVNEHIRVSRSTPRQEKIRNGESMEGAKIGIKGGFKTMYVWDPRRLPDIQSRVRGDHPASIILNNFPILRNTLPKPRIRTLYRSRQKLRVSKIFSLE